MTYEAKRAFMKQVDAEVCERASRADLYYVILFWLSPISETVEHRQGYFDDFTEASNYMFSMKEKYKDRKYFIASNTSSGDIDGGLL